MNADGDAQSSSLVLISAPGAVGKSTLARQIAAETGAIYVDLAEAAPVGANTLSGGLMRAGLIPQWSAQTSTVLIDGLDEARLRVTQGAFEAFLSDIAQLATGRRLPIVLFGRTGAVQEAWLVFADQGIQSAILEIGYYDQTAAEKFAEAIISVKKPADAHRPAERRAVSLLLERLADETKIDGGRFSGYAPVIQAVAERVLAESNPGALVSKIEGGQQPVTLKSVLDAIMERERSKLAGLSFSNPQIGSGLYSPEEQIEHLVARVFAVAPPHAPAMPPSDAQIYDEALKTWVPEHPFLDGNGQPSSAVFAALVSAAALKHSSARDKALTFELARGEAANPFLAEFYHGKEEDGHFSVPLEHVGALYASVRSRLKLGDAASLTVDAVDGANEAMAEVEMAVHSRGNEEPRILAYRSELPGIFRFGNFVADVDLNLPGTQVEIGLGEEVTLIAPISIQCESLSIIASSIFVEKQGDDVASAVHLGAGLYDGMVAALPIVRDGASLTVSWPDASSYPWTNFSTTKESGRAPELDEALRRLRKFIIAFRSHSKGSLARFADKLDHERMTKGMGQAVLDLLKADGIITLQGPMYHLDPVLLGSKAGVTYAEAMAHRFGKKTEQYVQMAITRD